MQYLMYLRGYVVIAKILLAWTLKRLKTCQYMHLPILHVGIGMIQVDGRCHIQRRDTNKVCADYVITFFMFYLNGLIAIICILCMYMIYGEHYFSVLEKKNIVLFYTGYSVKNNIKDVYKFSLCPCSLSIDSI